MKLDKYNLMYLVVGFCAGIVLGVAGIVLSGRSAPAPIVIEAPDPTPLPTPEPPPAPVSVFVNGAVNSPGVYEMPAASKIGDAINQAGGFTAEADADLINLAQPLLDGMQIRVPTVAERSAQAAPPVVIEPQTSADTGVGADSGGLVNINTADQALLETLPGVGPTTAANIIAYRDANGPFAAIESLLDVPGIGPSKFDEVKALITVGE
ncbi:MAG: ComEA family DNA-binding protein [Ardenticatenales bacterium]|nr:ComEA family DNA-binding protein [Ardenticatenales bacterium]